MSSCFHRLPVEVFNSFFYQFTTNDPNSIDMYLNMINYRLMPEPDWEYLFKRWNREMNGKKLKCNCHSKSICKYNRIPIDVINDTDISSYIDCYKILYYLICNMCKLNNKSYIDYLQDLAYIYDKDGVLYDLIIKNTSHKNTLRVKIDGTEYSIPYEEYFSLSGDLGSIIRYQKDVEYRSFFINPKDGSPDKARFHLQTILGVSHFDNIIEIFEHIRQNYGIYNYIWDNLSHVTRSSQLCNLVNYIITNYNNYFNLTQNSYFFYELFNEELFDIVDLLVKFEPIQNDTYEQLVHLMIEHVLGLLRSRRLKVEHLRTMKVAVSLSPLGADLLNVVNDLADDQGFIL